MIVLLMMAAVLHVMTVNLIGLLTDLNAVIQPGMSMVLTAPLLKAIMAGIVQDVAVQVMHLLYVVTVPVLVTKIVKPAKLTVAYAANVLRVRCLIVMDHMNVGQNPGLVMALLIVKISNMVLT
jgi:hypothetical protein